jgi:hypothetical protein
MDGMLKWAARAHVIDELMAEAVNVALPVGACDIEILAFLESRTEPCGLVALVWDIGELAPIRSFALTPAELTLVKMIDLMDGVQAARECAGAESGRARREAILQNAMKPFVMSRGEWRKKLMGIVGGRLTEPCWRHH